MQILWSKRFDPTTWKGHEGKGSEWTCYETNWSDRAGNDNKSKTPNCQRVGKLYLLSLPPWKDMKGKDMKATEKTWVDRSANELQEKEKARAMRKDYHPKAETRCILNPSSLLITCLGSCGPRCPVSSNLDLPPEKGEMNRKWQGNVLGMEGTEKTWMGNDNKQSYSHLWGTLPKSLGACEMLTRNISC